MIHAEPRRAVPLKVQRDVALALCADLMRKLGMVPVDVQVAFELDHDPPLALRAIDEVTGSHKPHQNDERFLVWRPKLDHRAKTTGRRGESDLSIRDGDQGKIAKVKRITADQEAFRRRLQAKNDGETRPTSRWPKRPLRSRNSFGGQR